MLKRMESIFIAVIAPVARLEQLEPSKPSQIIFGWEDHRMDVKLAFLDGEISKEIYVK